MPGDATTAAAREEGENGGTDRAVSEVIGFILVATILVIALTLVQVYAVPSQNEEIEFKHSQEVRTDLVAARNAILEAKRAGQSVPVSIRLAPQYPARLFTLNPPPPSGTLRSTENGTITVARANGAAVDVCPVTDQTRMVEYEARYNEYGSAPTIRYENTVVYEEYPTGRTRLLSGQSLVEGRTINLVPVLESFGRSGSDVLAFEPRPGRLEETRVVDPVLTVPTRLPAETWVELLGARVDPSAVSVTGGTLRVELSGAYLVSCSPVAINQQPPGGGRVATGSEINPAAPGDVVLVGSSVENPDVFRLTFNNTATEAINVTGARLSFYFEAQGGQDPDSADVYDTSVSASDLLAAVTELGPAVDFSTPVNLGPLAEHDLVLAFDDNVNEGDFFVLELTFEAGNTGTYFVGAEETVVGPGTNQAPTADFTFDRDFRGRVDLDGGPSSDPDGTLVSYEWDVGADGSIEYTGERVNNARDIPPGEEVSLTVTDDGGLTDSVTKTVP